MSGIENNTDAFFSHDVERAHIDDEVIVAEAGAALGDVEVIAVIGVKFFGDIDDIKWCEELTFFHVHGSASFSAGFDEVGLATEECWDLKQVNVLSSNFRFVWMVNISGDWDSEFFGNFPEDAGAFFYTWATEGIARGAVCLIVGCFEIKMDA